MDPVQPVAQALLADAAFDGHPHAVASFGELRELVLQASQILERLAEFVEALDSGGGVVWKARPCRKEGRQSFL